jgi:hypothetical protein
MHFPSPALILSCLALFAALGGSTYAATSIGSSGTIHFTKATLRNGWKNNDSGDAPAGYAKDSWGVVHLRGLINTGSSDSTAFVLPSGLRPHHYLYFPVYTFGGGVASLEINASGEVIPFGTNVSSGNSLDGISFAAGE